MLLSGQATLIGLEQKHGVKDPNKVYSRALLQDGLDTIQVLCNDDVYTILSAGEMYVTYGIVLDYNTKYNSMRLVEVS